MEKKVTVIIPAHNEERSIASVIEIAKNDSLTNEIIVVTNKCTDDTEQISKNAGAIVVNCDTLGKGYAMAEGVKAASNEVIVFLDADIINYNTNIVSLLASPVLNNEADFVKSTFDRVKGGTVTKLVVQPLLKTLYPDLYEFQEPISGMIASKKSILEKLTFETDYGVDIAIVLDIYKLGIKMKEVNIGEILNMSHEAKTIETMQKMSSEIIRAIIKKSKEHNIL